MPNWCSIDMFIHGPKKDMNKFVKGIKDDSIIDSYHPCPKALHNTQLVDKSLLSKRTVAKQKRLSQKYGYSYWYDWCIHNWSVKWPDSETTIQMQDRRIICNMEIAWTPPVAAIEHISKKFTTLKFIIKWFESGCAQKGIVIIKNGIVLDTKTFPYHGTRGG